MIGQMRSHRYSARPRPGRLPLLVLGISGVVVLDDPDVPATAHRVSAWGRWARQVVIPDTAREKIAELTQYFEIAWASEWGHNAHTALGGPLDLPQEPWPFLPVQFNKLTAIRQYADGAPWVWVDEPVTDLSGIPEATDGVIVRTNPQAGLASIEPQDLLEAINRKTQKTRRVYQC